MPEKQKATLSRMTIVGGSDETAQIFRRHAAVAEGVFFTRELVTEPANIIYPESFVERCQHLRELGVEITVLGEDVMQRLGMGALLSVSQGSDRPARLLAMRWAGTGGAVAMPAALLSHGVTIDSGGMSTQLAAGREAQTWR